MFKHGAAAAAAVISGLSLFLQGCGPAEFQPIGRTTLKSVEEEVVLEPPPGPPKENEEKEKIRTPHDPILADRFYLKSLIEDVFGPRAAAVDSSRSFLNALDHGSACSIYTDHNIYEEAGKRWVPADRMEVCGVRSTALLAAQVNPKSTVTRQALLTRACSDLTTDENTLTHALGRISPDAVPRADRENMLKLFRLFYRDKSDPADRLLESLRVIFPAAGAGRDHWRVALFTVCASSYWQVL